jgi:pyruvate,water dikinase
MHRHLLWWREEMRDYSSKMYYHIRKMLLIIGRKMAEEGLLNEVNDVFFLKFEELFDYTNSKDKVKYLTRIEKNKIFYRSFKNFRNPNEIWQHKDFTKTTESIKSGTSTLVGIAGAHGYVKGKAMVIESIFDAESIREGDILVTKFTDPSWTIYFARISGLVTESGGMLSHGAVVSREYGIPAVLGVKNSTKIIKSGDTIEIDGDSGIVNILKHD